ncbi:hypothetical protein MPSEU_000455800 [Mayamaea pseudoterrestris]|nr:hypothetical protein MPSEU_000455800 [Mayamaea pseudoterrestris]
MNLAASAKGSLLYFGVPIILIVTTTVLLFTTPSAPKVDEYHVAFIGNSITFANDLPRFMQALSRKRIQQQSCLHGSLSLRSHLTHGNGMYHKWNTKQALDDNGQYDFGSCTVPQLLFGYDDNLASGNENGYYKNDGKNPCFSDSSYYDYMAATYEQQGPPQWDFVVMNDRTTFPAVYDLRQKSLNALQNYYVNYLQTTGAQPVLLMTYAYNYQAFYNVTNDDDNSNGDDDDDDDDPISTQVGDIAEFSSHLYHGYMQYARLLNESLERQTLVAPIGLAFLTIWEESFEMWQKLFYTDYLHPSPLGTYLMGCVLYATIYQRMPSIDAAMDISNLWARARRMEVWSEGPTMALPTRDEAAYLLRVAERVALQQHLPKSLLSEKEVMEIENDYRNQQYQDDKVDDNGATDDGNAVVDETVTDDDEY